MPFKSAPCFICHNTFDFDTVKGDPVHPVCPTCGNKIKPQLAIKQNLLDKTHTENARND
ncbi:MAG: hypothetical protein AB9Q17_02405 [Candidatus Reddybacter sp.]